MHQGLPTETQTVQKEIHHKDTFDQKQNLKRADPLMTPQRKNDPLRKQILDKRLSKTEPPIRFEILEAGSEHNISAKNAFLSNFIEKENKYTGCNCRKSQCLKMYCTCFAVGKMCDETCLCDSCKNGEDNMERSEAINQIIEKDPFAFSKKQDPTNVAFQEQPCNCRKSNCTKKYCDCYRRGKACTSKCNCVECHNCTAQDLEIQSNSSLKKKLKFD